MFYPETLVKLISVLRKLPGVGSKTAERFAFHLLDWPQDKLEEMSEIIKSSKQKLKGCPTCGALIDITVCPFCDLHKRESRLLCVVASPKDIFCLEETHEYRGLYQVLGTLLSPLEGKKLDQQVLNTLKQRIKAHNVEEVILALDSTLEGDATALYLKKELDTLSVRTSRLALGLPMGSSLDLIDGGTLARALAGRMSY